MELDVFTNKSNVNSTTSTLIDHNKNPTQNNLNLSLNFANINNHDIHDNEDIVNNPKNLNSNGPKNTTQHLEEILKERELKSRGRIAKNVIKPVTTSYVIGGSEASTNSTLTTDNNNNNNNTNESNRVKTINVQNKGLSELDIQSHELIPKQFLLNLEAEALAAATEFGVLITSLHSSMEKITGISVQSMSAFSFSTDKLTEGINTSITQMNAFLQSCQELENNSKDVYELATQISEIKKMLDKFELLIIKLIRPPQ